MLISNRRGAEPRGWQVTKTKGCSIDDEGCRGAGPKEGSVFR